MKHAMMGKGIGRMLFIMSPATHAGILVIKRKI
jgi:hypothetical protein